MMLLFVLLDDFLSALVLEELLQFGYSLSVHAHVIQRNVRESFEVVSEKELIFEHGAVVIVCLHLALEGPIDLLKLQFTVFRAVNGFELVADHSEEALKRREHLELTVEVVMSFFEEKTFLGLGNFSGAGHRKSSQFYRLHERRFRSKRNLPRLLDSLLQIRK